MRKLKQIHVISLWRQGEKKKKKKKKSPNTLDFLARGEKKKKKKTKKKKQKKTKKKKKHKTKNLTLYWNKIGYYLKRSLRLNTPSNFLREGLKESFDFTHVTNNHLFS